MDATDAIEGVWEELGVDVVEGCDSLELLYEETGERVGELSEIMVDRGMARVTIFTPLLVLVLAGMKRVVCWFGAGIEIRLG